LLPSLGFRVLSFEFRATRASKILLARSPNVTELKEGGFKMRVDDDVASILLATSSDIIELKEARVHNACR